MVGSSFSVKTIKVDCLCDFLFVKKVDCLCRKKFSRTHEESYSEPFVTVQLVPVFGRMCVSGFQPVERGEEGCV